MRAIEETEKRCASLCLLPAWLTVCLLAWWLVARPEQVRLWPVAQHRDGSKGEDHFRQTRRAARSEASAISHQPSNTLHATDTENSLSAIWSRRGIVWWSCRRADFIVKPLPPPKSSVPAASTPAAFRALAAVFVAQV